MAKDDFDTDFHFDDDDFDPKAFLDGEDGADIDLSEFDDVPSGGDKLDETVADGYDDELDLSGLGLDEDSDETVDELDLDDILSPKAVRRNSQEHDDFGTNKQEDDSDFDGTEFLDDEDDQTQAAPEDDSDFQSDLDIHDAAVFFSVFQHRFLIIVEIDGKREFRIRVAGIIVVCHSQCLYSLGCSAFQHFIY